MRTIGTTIKNARVAVGLSQRELANYITRVFGKDNNISHNFLSEVENDVHGIGIKKLNLVTTALVKLGAK